MPETINYMSNSDRGSVLQAYDINHPVGMGHGVVNQREDVCLVQTLLLIIYFVYPMERTKPAPAGTVRPAADGHYNRATHVLLAHFKEGMRERDWKTPKDGKVDPIKADPNTKTKHGYFRVMSALNFVAFVSCRNAGHPADYDLHRLSSDRGFAVDPKLFAALQTHKLYFPQGVRS